MEKETFTWLEPGTWRKPCIVHVTMVAKDRQPLFGILTHDGTHAIVEKTAIGWVLVNQQQRMLQLCPEMKILADKVMPNHHHIVLQVMRTMPPGGVFFEACSKGKLLLLEPTEETFVVPPIRYAVENTLRLKAEAKHICYAPIPESSQRYRFLALNEMGRVLVEGGAERQ